MSEGIVIEGSQDTPEVVEAALVASKALSDLEETLLTQVRVNGQEVTLMDDAVIIKGVGGINKTISYEDFISSVLRATNTLSEETKLSLSLPGSVSYLAVGPTELDISCYYKEGVKPFQFSDGSRMERYDIVVPNIIVSHKLRRERGDWVHNGAFYTVTNMPVNKLPQDRLITTMDRDRGIFLMPFTNAYDSCNMCYGGNKMPVRFIDNNLRGLDYYYNFLWESPFNNDLGISSKVNRNMFSSPVQWYHHLRDLAIDNKPFPYGDLRR